MATPKRGSGHVLDHAVDAGGWVPPPIGAGVEVR